MQAQLFTTEIFREEIGMDGGEFRETSPFVLYLSRLF